MTEPQFYKAAAHADKFFVCVRLTPELNQTIEVDRATAMQLADAAFKTQAKDNNLYGISVCHESETSTTLIIGSMV